MNCADAEYTFNLFKMPKDRLQEMHEVKSGKKDKKQRKQSSDQDDLTRFFAEVERIKSLILELAAKIDTLSQLQNDLFTKPFDREKIQAQIGDVSNVIRQSSRQVRVDLNKLEETCKQSRSDSETTSRIKSTQLSTLVTDFVTSIHHFNALEVTHQEKSLENLRRLRGQGLEDDPEAGQSVLEQLRLAEKARLELGQLEERFESFKRLEGSLEELNNMFTDMNMLVERQGEIVTRIETATESAEVRVAGAADQTKKGLKLQMAARKKKLICGAVGVVALLIIILIIVLSFVA